MVFCSHASNKYSQGARVNYLSTPEAKLTPANPLLLTAFNVIGIDDMSYTRKTKGLHMTSDCSLISHIPWCAILGFLIHQQPKFPFSGIGFYY